MNVYKYLINTIEEKGSAYFVLIDPDKMSEAKLPEFLNVCNNSEVDALLVGGSLLLHPNLAEYISLIKQNSSLPVAIFPGSVAQVTNAADAVLFLSLISGRNADHLIGKHVIAAPLIKKVGIEPISTGYMLIDSGKQTTAEYMSGSRPIPRNKPDIAASTALAAEYLGMKFIYLEAGSGADNPVPTEMVNAVASVCSIPLIVGGGLRDTESIRERVRNGAKIIVTGNFFEDSNNWNEIKKFADAVHLKPVEV